MEIVVGNSTLSAMLLEILLKNKSLALDVFKNLIKDDPHFLKELTPISDSTLVSEPFVDSKTEKEELLLEKTEINDTEIRILAKQQFAKYDAVFKALA
jgi:hypothetical protein